MTSDRQMPLPLPTEQALGRADYFVSSANAMALALIDGWRDWSPRKLVLVGPAGAGKTHLARIWAQESWANTLAARDLVEADIPALAEGNVVVEDVTEIAEDRAAEEALFHLHNLVLAQGHTLLMTADTPPVEWALTLPDLKSRMMGCQTATLSEPDDTLLAALLAKLFADRQIVPTPKVIPYLIRHMPRSFAMARAIVTALDAAALGTAKGVNRPLAQRVLAQLEQAGENLPQ
ncbi:MAG: DnaA/Hda family protein [Paracoccaceae bacterium]|nr:DnaA/Hda family protein [Paracoccaceae bacterium]